MGGGAPNWAEIATALVATTSAICAAASRYLYTLLDAKISKKSEALHRKIDDQRTELHSKIDAQQAKLLEVLSEEVAEMRTAIVAEGRSYGDSVEAVREKIVQVELFIRDSFVRRDEFQTAMQQLNNSVQAMRSSQEAANKSTDEKLERIRVSLENKIEKNGPR